MEKKILIDALHPEETRAVVLDQDGLIQEFNCETIHKKQLKGNLYLVKVARIEPSLQAAFVDYGAERNGFIPFNEIHTDYYRIPIDDREKKKIDIVEQNTIQESNSPSDEKDPESSKLNIKKRYKIQEVIHKNQILLAQVVREERGNKGAALTTHISLSGRYCVLMINNPIGGGISRRIVDHSTRKKMKTLLQDLKVPEGMSVIIRTAGHERTKTEIKKDLEYLIRLWEEIRKKTLDSKAPALVHEEAGLIKRTIRDYYQKDIQEIIVAGVNAYKDTKAFMKQILPTHAKKVSLYKGSNHTSFFNYYHVEQQLSDLHSPCIQLKSGGSIVIHQTEALVSIDVNSGKSTKERHIDETAFKTNIEAAKEIARQLHLRDLGGLIVIDFIDMNEQAHIQKLEQCFKEAIKNDHARIQVGSISVFGLLELSRQRLNPSILETTGRICTTCKGVGYIKSTASIVLAMLREVENLCHNLQRNDHALPLITIEVCTDVALYALNEKRRLIHDIEQMHKVIIVMKINDRVLPMEYIIHVPTQEKNKRAIDAKKKSNPPQIVSGNNQKKNTQNNEKHIQQKKHSTISTAQTKIINSQEESYTLQKKNTEQEQDPLSLSHTDESYPELETKRKGWWNALIKK